MEQKVHFVLLAEHPESLTVGATVVRAALARPHLAVPAFPCACLWDRDSSIEKLCWQVLALLSVGQYLKGELEGPVGAEQAAPWVDFG